MNAAAQQRELVANARCVVVKIGSSSLTSPDGHLNTQALHDLVQVLAARINSGGHVVLVSSGAVAAGIGPLGLKTRPRDLATIQAAASVGQGLLVAQYTKEFAAHRVQVAQVLLTSTDTVRRSHYKNAQRALGRLLELGVLPIVNENDSVATEELRFGDNDRLAAIVSHLVGADALVLLTDVDGLYDGPPSRGGAKRIPVVTGPQDLAGIEVTGRGSSVGTGGMLTKLESVQIASASGIPVVLTSAEQAAAALAGQPVGTFFTAGEKRPRSRSLWLAHAAKAKGKVTIDSGAVQAVLGGKASLLAAGVTEISGSFEAGDPVEVTDANGKVIARGLAAYGSGELPEVIGRAAQEASAEAGKRHRPVIHRDDLVLVTRQTKAGRA